MLKMDNYDIDKPLYTIDDEEPLYNIEEPDPDNGDNYAHDSDPDGGDDDLDDDDYLDDDDEDDEEDEEDEEESKAKPWRPSPLWLMFKTMIGPVEGWKSLKRARIGCEEFASRCFYPMIGVAAISEAASVFYKANYSISDWAMEGLFTFITFFFGYFTVLLLGGVILPKESRDVLKKDIGKQFVMLALSTLALFWAAIQIFPMFDPVLVFLPIWTIYIVFKGVRILRVPKDVENSTTGLLCMLVIGVPVFWYWVMTEIFTDII